MRPVFSQIIDQLCSCITHFVSPITLNSFLHDSSQVFEVPVRMFRQYHFVSIIMFNLDPQLFVFSNRVVENVFHVLVWDRDLTGNVVANLIPRVQERFKTSVLWIPNFTFCKSPTL